MVLLSVGLFACSNEKVERTEFEILAQRLDETLPLFIRHDLDLPVVETANVVWFHQGISLGTQFSYQPPRVDSPIVLSAQITMDGMTETFYFERTLLSLESARNYHVITIQTEDKNQEILRNDYLDITFRLEGPTELGSPVIFETDEVEIRGRGNSTWGMPKKPYRIRFKEAVSILGMPEARNYVLLAEYADKSLLRNTLVHLFSSQLEHLEHTITTRVVELYLNGSYQGVYTLTEHVELAPEKLFFEAERGVIDTGYFLELDQRFFDKGGVDMIDGFVIEGYPYEIVRPDPRHRNYDPNQTVYIRNTFLALEAALIAKSGYEAYMDVDNFIDYFIVQELFKNVDVGWSSVFIYKRPGDVIRMGPLWDFDLAIGNANYIDYGPENWYGMRDSKNRWFKLMMDVPEIRERFKERYLEIYETILPDFIDAIPVMGTAFEDLAARNFRRWRILDIYVWPNPDEMVGSRRYVDQVDYVHHFIKARATWMAQEVQTDRFARGQFNP